MRRHTISFLHAFEGLVHAFATQPNFIVHVLISTSVTVAGLLLHISPIHWAILALTIGVGLSIELINTSIESVVDLASPKYHELAKIAKDCAAAAMLLYAVFAVLVAAFIFL